MKAGLLKCSIFFLTEFFGIEWWDCVVSCKQTVKRNILSLKTSSLPKDFVYTYLSLSCVRYPKYQSSAGTLKSNSLLGAVDDPTGVRHNRQIPSIPLRLDEHMDETHQSTVTPGSDLTDKLFYKKTMGPFFFFFITCSPRHCPSDKIHQWIFALAEKKLFPLCSF